MSLFWLDSSFFIWSLRLLPSLSGVIQTLKKLPSPRPHLLGYKNSVLPPLIAANIYFTKKTWVQTKLWTFQRTGTDVYSKYGFAALMCGRLFILSCKHWTWLMMMSLKYSVCSMSTKPGLMEIDHRGGSNVSMCLFELSWIYFSFTYLLKSNRNIYMKFVYFLSSEALLATSAIANFKNDNIPIWVHQDGGNRLNIWTIWTHQLLGESPSGSTHLSGPFRAKRYHSNELLFIIFFFNFHALFVRWSV